MWFHLNLQVQMCCVECGMKNLLSSLAPEVWLSVLHGLVGSGKQLQVCGPEPGVHVLVSGLH